MKRAYARVHDEAVMAVTECRICLNGPGNAPDEARAARRPGRARPLKAAGNDTLRAVRQITALAEKAVSQARASDNESAIDFGAAAGSFLSPHQARRDRKEEG
jgi:hypothetical protein